MRVEFHNLSETKFKLLKFVVIQARYYDSWVFVRHKDRVTWEIPGGHIEENELPDQAAKRELYEETRAIKFNLTPICDYSVTRNAHKSYGRLYFSEILTLGKLNSEYEMAELILTKDMPQNLTYPEIQPHLFTKVIDSLVVKSNM